MGGGRRVRASGLGMLAGGRRAHRACSGEAERAAGGRRERAFVGVGPPFPQDFSRSLRGRWKRRARCSVRDGCRRGPLCQDRLVAASAGALG